MSSGHRYLRFSTFPGVKAFPQSTIGYAELKNSWELIFASPQIREETGRETVDETKSASLTLKSFSVVLLAPEVSRCNPNPTK